MAGYWVRVAAAASQLLNALAGGHNDMTVSARAHVQTHLGPRARIARRIRAVINAAFFLGADHCRASWQRDEKWVAEVEEISARLREKGIE